MKKFEANIFLWSSPLLCIDPERSSYDYSFLRSNLKKRKLLIAASFLIKSTIRGLKKIKSRKIFYPKFILNGENKNILYTPSIFINSNNKKCSYFPSSDENTSFLIIDNEKTFKAGYLKILFQLFIHILPEFRKFNTNKKFLEKIINWIIFSSYFLSLDAIVNYFLACGVDKLSSNYPESNHICLHEMHPYSRIVYGVLTFTNSISYTLQHALIHPTRLLFDLKKNNNNFSYIPDNIYIWSKETKDVLINFGWPSENIKFCASERFLKLRNVVSKNNYSTSNKINTNFNKSVLLIPSLLRDDFNLAIKSALLIRSSEKNIRILIKLHPSFELSFLDKLYILFLNAKSIFFTNENIKELFKDKPLTLTYSSTAVYEAAIYECPAFFIPTSSKYDGNELILEKMLLALIDKYKKDELFDKKANPFYISPESAKLFFGLDRKNFFPSIQK